MEYVAIFEGGGAKGLAHIGALKATEEKKIYFKSIGGTSAGAIIASLVASGYTADELYNPDTSTGVFSINLIDLLNQDTWKSFEAILKTIDEIENSNWPKTKSYFAYRRHKNDINKIINDYGFFDTTTFSNWLEATIRKKLNLNRSVLFKDLKFPLTIIATNISKCNIQIYSSHSTPDAKVSEAVTASLSIPVFFKPVSNDNNAYLVDGGIVSNYPTWIFDTEREETEGRLATLGYKLVETRSSTTSKNDNFFQYLVKVLNSALWGDQELEVRGIENLHSIPLKVSTGTLDFKLNDKMKEKLYNEGKDSASLYFKMNIGLGQHSKVSETLEILTLAAKSIIDDKSGSPIKHLRSNVIVPTFHDSDRLRLLYSFGMENDTDDALLIKENVGAAGVCCRRMLRRKTNSHM